jgi:hypothetical protein
MAVTADVIIHQMSATAAPPPPEKKTLNTTTELATDVSVETSYYTSRNCW